MSDRPVASFKESREAHAEAIVSLLAGPVSLGPDHDPFDHMSEEDLVRLFHLAQCMRSIAKEEKEMEVFLYSSATVGSITEVLQERGRSPEEVVLLLKATEEAHMRDYPHPYPQNFHPAKNN